jgi:hypothetical protein
MPRDNISMPHFVLVVIERGVVSGPSPMASCRGKGVLVWLVSGKRVCVERGYTLQLLGGSPLSWWDVLDFSMYVPT